MKGFGYLGREVWNMKMSDVTNSKTIMSVAMGCLTKCSYAFQMFCLLAMYCNGNKDGSLHVLPAKPSMERKLVLSLRGR